MIRVFQSVEITGWKWHKGERVFRILARFTDHDGDIFLAWGSSSLPLFVFTGKTDV
jgi:hypothetical protein